MLEVVFVLGASINYCDSVAFTCRPQKVFESIKSKVVKGFILFLKACMATRWRRKMQKGSLQ